MTRINLGILPKNLTDSHLCAELRELPRIFTAVKKRLEQGKSFDDIPEKFILGTGHCKFFYDKLFFLDKRYSKLLCEYRERFWVNGKENNWMKAYNGFDIITISKNKLFNSYHSTPEERQLLIDRISTRIMESKQIPRYYGQTITKERAIEILKS